MLSNFINFTTVIDRLLKNPNLSNLSYEDALTSAIDVISFLGIGDTMQLKPPLLVNFTNYKFQLPPDLVNLIGIRRLNITGTDYIPIYASTDNYLIGYSKNNPSSYNAAMMQDTYTMRNGWLFFSTESGSIEILYEGLMLDEDENFYIPDNISIIKAIENYIKLQYYTPLWEMGKIPDKVFQKTEQEYNWYLGQAESASKALSIDQREALKNSMLTLIRNKDEYKTSFRTLGQPEYLKKHRS